MFTNDFSALLPSSEIISSVPLNKKIEDDLLVSQKVGGSCKVICFSPRHDLTLPEMDVKEITGNAHMVRSRHSKFNKMSLKHGPKNTQN